MSVLVWIVRRGLVTFLERCSKRRDGEARVIFRRVPPDF